MQKLKEFIKKPAVIIITCIAIPFLIIGLLHLVNFLGTKFGIDLNPSGIDNAGWFSFLGSFLGGICTLIAVLLTLSDNKKALEQSQRQAVYQAEMQQLVERKKTLSDALISFTPSDVLRYLMRFKQIINLDGSYDKTETLNIINEIYKTLIQIDSSKQQIELETNITNRCYETCNYAKECDIAKVKKEFTDFFFTSYSNIYDALNRIIDLLELLKKGANDLNISEEMKNEIIKNFSKIGNDVEIIKSIKVEFIPKLIGSAKNYFALGEDDIEKQLKGLSNFNCKRLEECKFI